MQSNLRVKASTKRGRPITWAQINLEAAEDLRDLVMRNKWAAALVLALIERMDMQGGGVVICSRETMKELLQCSMPTVDRALKLIIEEGWVQRIKVGGASALAINSRVAWVGPRGDLPHAVFSATVIASRSEQDQIALNPPPIRQIPVLKPDEMPIAVGSGKTPPSQPDFESISPAAAIQGKARIDEETGEIYGLERRGQGRLIE